MSRGIAFSISLIVVLGLMGLILSFLINLFLVPFIPTPKKVLKEIIDAMQLKDKEKIIDLGSGDGRLLIAARKEAKIKGIGYEISPFLIWFSRLSKFINFKFTEDISFELESLTKAKIEKADKIFCYLTPHALKSIKHIVKRKLKDTALVYSYEFVFPNMSEFQIHELSNGKKLYVYNKASFENEITDPAELKKERPVENIQ